jgi:hypothetical protein
MDDRIQKWIANAAGLPVTAFPGVGIYFQVSQARTDEPKNRLLVQRITGQNGVLVTGIPLHQPGT